MNPFLYKAPPLLLRWLDILAHPSAYALDDALDLALTFLVINSVFALTLRYATQRLKAAPLPFAKNSLLAVPACLLYILPMLTVLSAVVARDFHWEDRFIPVFTLFVSSQMLGVFYTVALRYWGGRLAIDIGAGMAVSLLLLLVSIPLCLALLALHTSGVLSPPP